MDDLKKQQKEFVERTSVILVEGEPFGALNTAFVSYFSFLRAALRYRKYRK